MQLWPNVQLNFKVTDLVSILNLKVKGQKWSSLIFFFFFPQKSRATPVHLQHFVDHVINTTVQQLNTM